MSGHGSQAIQPDLREGDLLALPIDDAAADVVLSVFGVIFAGAVATGDRVSCAPMAARC